MDRYLLDVVGQIADRVGEAGVALSGSCAAGSWRAAVWPLLSPGR
jgi:hypothetical protein